MVLINIQVSAASLLLLYELILHFNIRAGSLYHLHNSESSWYPKTQVWKCVIKGKFGKLYYFCIFFYVCKFFLNEIF